MRICFKNKPYENHTQLKKNLFDTYSGNNFDNFKLNKVEMADTIAEAVQQAAENLTENANVKIPASPEGMFLAYSSLVIMAVLPIFFGSKRSVSHQKEQKVSKLMH